MREGRGFVVIITILMVIFLLTCLVSLCIAFLMFYRDLYRTQISLRVGIIAFQLFCVVEVVDSMLGAKIFGDNLFIPRLTVISMIVLILVSGAGLVWFEMAVKKAIQEDMEETMDMRLNGQEEELADEKTEDSDDFSEKPVIVYEEILEKVAK